MHRGSVVLLCLVFVSVDGRLAQDGVYTAEQAARGRAVYQQQCMACHGEKLEGGEGPPLAGPIFMQLWNVPYRTLDDFYYTTSEFMPKDLPASLGQRAYLDVVAYVLQSNGYSAGDEALTADRGVLKSIRIEPQN